jgi:hypothetical protein
MSPALIVTEAEMETALRLFAEAVAVVAGAPDRILIEAQAAGAITGVEEAV